jgi:hypothetical protein
LKGHIEQAGIAFFFLSTVVSFKNCFFSSEIIRFTKVIIILICAILYFTFLGNYFNLPAMTIEEAFEELIASSEFKGVAKLKDSQGGKYRSYLSLHKKGSLKIGAMVPILVANGYTISANKASKKSKR